MFRRLVCMVLGHQPETVEPTAHPTLRLVRCERCDHRTGIAWTAPADPVRV